MKPIFQLQKLLLFIVVLVTLSSCDSLYKTDSGKDVEIKIIRGDEKTGELILDPSDKPEPVEVFPGKKVIWSIDETTAANVQSLSISKKPGSKQIFVIFRHPPSSRTRRGDGLVDWFRKDAVYEYSINWTDDKGQPHSFDPKIAVKPPPFIPFIALVKTRPSILLLLLGFIITLITSIVFYRRWRRAEARLTGLAN